MEVLLREKNFLKEENIRLKMEMEERKQQLLSHHAIDMESKSSLLSETKRAHAKQVQKMREERRQLEERLSSHASMASDLDQTKRELRYG